MKREKRAQGRAPPQASGTVSGDRVEDNAAAGPKEREVKVNDKDLDNRVWVGGLPSDSDEQLLLEHFGSCGPIRNVKLIRNSRLVFRGSCFVSFKKRSGMQAALELDGTELKEQVINVKTAGVPVAAPDLKVYIAGLPWKATEEVLKKDFSECGEIAKLHLLKDRSTGKFKGVMFVTYKSQSGVDAALKFHDTEYGGKLICVRLASAEPSQKPGSDVLSGKRARKAAEHGTDERGEVVEEATSQDPADAAETDATSRSKKVKGAKKARKKVEGENKEA